jgi:acyl-CoA thioesterase I
LHTIKRHIWLKTLVFICITITLLSCGKTPKLKPIPTGATVVILGDSLSFGTGANKGEDYPTLLAKNTGWNIVNAGVPGNTSAQGLERLPMLLNMYQPNLLIIELGGNDFLQKLDVNQTVENLNRILQIAKESHIQTLLMAIPDYQPLKAAFVGLSDHPLYATLSQKTNTPVLEEVFTKVLADNALKADYVHPNADGYKKVEERIRFELKDIGLLK